MEADTDKPTWQTMDWTKRISERPWHGFLSHLTVEGIYKAISRTLTGKTFTVVVCRHDYATWKLPDIEVRTGCKLRADWIDMSQDPIKWEKLTSPAYSTIQFSAGGYHMIFNTNYDGHPCYGLPMEYKSCPYFKLEHGRFTVWEKNYDGFVNQWRFEVEGELFDPYDCDHLSREQLEKIINELRRVIASKMKHP